MSETKEEEPLEKKHFEGADVKVDVELGTRCRVKMAVRPGEELWKKARKQASKKIAKEVSIPGFRKGKAPDSIIEKKYPGVLKEESEKTIANIAFEAAQKEAKVLILNGNSQVNFHLNKDDSEELIFQFETEPEIPTADPKDFKLEKEEVEVIDDAKLQETVEGLQMFYAEWEQVEDRPIEKGDFIVLDIDDIDQDPPVQAFSSARFEVKKEKMADWMIDLVMGKKVGDEIEGESKPDEDADEEVKKAFQVKKVKIHIKAIEKAKLPPIDDKLAKKVGTSCVDAMNKKLMKILDDQQNETVLVKQRESIAEQLCEKYPFEIPASILEKEANHRMAQLFKNPDYKKKWNDEMSEEEKEAKKDEIKKSASNAIMLFYLCRKIVADNKIELPESELAPSYDSLLEMMFADPNKLNYANQSKERQSMEFTKFMLTKAENWLIEQVKANQG